MVEEIGGRKRTGTSQIPKIVAFHIHSWNPNDNEHHDTKRRENITFAGSL